MNSSLRYFLDQFKSGPRLFYVGNLSNQSFFQDVKYRIAIDSITTDVAINKTSWMRIYPGLDKNQLNYLTDKWKNFLLLVLV